MTLEKTSGCKINLLLNVLGRRDDGFHEVETVMQPLPLYDRLRFESAPSGIALSCDHPDLPTDSGNLVYRAAKSFFERTGITAGVRIHLAKTIPVSAGLGGGSGNAAATLLGLNELFEFPLTLQELVPLAALLGSDIPFFLEEGPALAVGRGERVTHLPPFAALRGASVILVHPGFGVSTPWAYQALAAYPEAVRGKPGRAQRLINVLNESGLGAAAEHFYNALEVPVLKKYPLLAMIREFFQEQGAAAALMSGSGSTIFAVVNEATVAASLQQQFVEKFGETFWSVQLQLHSEISLGGRKPAS